MPNIGNMIIYMLRQTEFKTTQSYGLSSINYYIKNKIPFFDRLCNEIDLKTIATPIEGVEVDKLEVNSNLPKFAGESQKDIVPGKFNIEQATTVATKMASQMLWNNLGNPDIITISPICFDAGITNIQASGKVSFIYMRFGPQPGWYSQLSGGGTLGIVSPKAITGYFNAQENISVTVGVTLGWIIGGDANKASSAILNGRNVWSLSAGAGEGLYGAGSFSVSQINEKLGGGYLFSLGGQFGVGEGVRWSFGYTPTWSTNAERVYISDY